MTPLARQIADELGVALAGPVRSLLGLDLAEEIESRVAALAGGLAAQLAQEDDDRLSAQTCVDLMAALWPHADPDPEWWGTPLGQACARSAGTERAYSVSHSVAASMLGVTRGTIAQLMSRGTLDRHPDGGVLVGSILDYAERRRR